jgi:2-methylcitrate dehydratase PrpD
MERIKVRAEESFLTAGYPQAWPAHVTVTTRAKRHERSVMHVPGDPTRPLGEDALQQKFSRMAARALKDQSAETVFAAALGGIDNPAGIIGEIDRLAAA